MSQEPEPKAFSFQAISGKVDVKCPICGFDKFLDTGPTKDEERRGFRHVIVGVSGKKRLAYLPIRFKFCANCGFILQFMIPSRNDAEDSHDSR